MSLWTKIIPAILFVACLALGLHAWRSSRQDAVQLKAALDFANQALAVANSRQQDRDVQLQKTLASLGDAKRRAGTATPAQIVRNLPTLISLPKPITLAPPPETSASLGSVPGSHSQPTEPQAYIPIEDLKPLQDFAYDCQACQLRLTATQADLQDERTKTQALTVARDAAVNSAKGGTRWKRISRAAKWLLIGAVAGAVAAKSAH